MDDLPSETKMIGYILIILLNIFFCYMLTMLWGGLLNGG